MLKGRILGIFCWICLFSECFFEQQGCGVAVGFCLQNGCGLCLQEGCGLCLQEGCGLCLLKAVGFCLLEGCELCLLKAVGFCLQKGCGLCLQKGCGLCLFLSLFLRDLVMLESEYRLLEKRKQPARKEKAACSDRESNFPEQIITIAWIDGLKIF